MGPNGAKGLLETGRKYRCGKEVTHSNVAIEEHRHCQHHMGSSESQPLAPDAPPAHVRARRQGQLDEGSFEAS